ncbi:MAG: FHA domain-containing protein [Cyanobacteriota bacterium]
MKEITLEWQEFGRTKIYTIYDQQPSKNLGTVRIGRNPAECDIVLSDPTVSGLHVEIFFNASTQTFLLRNLRYSNPPIVDDRQIVAELVALRSGSIIYLGQLELRVVGVSLHQSSNGIAPTILLPPQPLGTIPSSIPAGVFYGLECPKCHRVSPYERMEWGCQWCGTSLAAASSVLMSPNP